MIAFVSLFLGLLAGTHSVQVMVGSEVARVEIRLDDELVGVLDGAPWTLDCDLGDDVVPHELVAIAFDAEGHETGRVRQWLNLPQPPAAAELIIEEEAGGAKVARVSYASVVSGTPEVASASFDGQPLEVEDLQRIPLPPHDPDQLHFIRIELDFADNVTSVVEAVLGGRFGESINTELTAVPVTQLKGKKLPDPDSLDGWLAKDGAPLPVVAVEKGPAEVTFVVGLAAHRRLARLAQTGGRRSQGAFSQRQSLQYRQSELANRFSLRLKTDQRLRFLWPIPKHRHQLGYDMVLFPPSDEYTPWDGGVYWHLTRVRRPFYHPDQQRLADAVAVAGVASAGRNRRRAVVLVTSANAADSSQLAPAAVRRYLDSIRVPLIVWSPDPEIAGSRTAWGDVTDISTLAGLKGAVKDLARQLERQRILWVESLHLPNEIQITEIAANVALAR